MCFSPRQLADSEYAESVKINRTKLGKISRQLLDSEYAEIATLSHATLSHKITAAV